PCPKRVGGVVADIGQQTVGEVVLLAELDVAGDRVRRYAEDLDAGRQDACVVVAQRAGLGGAARGVVLRIEVHDIPLPNEAFVRDGRSVILLHLERRNRVPDLRVAHAGIVTHPISSIATRTGGRSRRTRRPARSAATSPMSSSPASARSWPAPGTRRTDGSLPLAARAAARRV